ncbi:CBN-CAB-1 protein [Caenorhabditis brenneri]|uniref:CBN-CAB-1 protein n=1 Tax=Caenorhabditis brenneri TaxID=135651 RepID=G0MHD4_CAEBE|nr:CBN-CAB-1 protein [Caenorhabditis brenneri]
MRYRVSDEKKAATTASSQTESQARLSNSASCRRAASSTLRPSYGMGMWRAVVLLACLSATHAALFTEGGAVLNGQDNKANKNVELAHDEKANYEDYLEYFEQNNKQEEEPAQQQLEDEYLEYMVQEMNRLQNTPNFPNFDEQPEERQDREAEDYPGPWFDMFPHADPNPLGPAKAEKKSAQKAPLAPEHHKPVVAQKPVAQEPFDLDDLLKGELLLENEIAKESELKKTQEKLSKESDAAKVNVESLESAMQTATGEPQVPQKKGQNEFVSFVEPEPQPAKQTVSSQSIDKRRLATSAEYSGNAPRYSNSGLLLLAVGTVMCVGLVGTVTGGAYYYKNRRRTETPDDGEYAPYAGTGPGFRKNKGNKGDETLAYKAQLHQYQQAKQKIICGEDAPGIIESDGEDGADEENNYSVYECPGLAPTGDIEVCNPNFAAQP